MKLDSGLTLQLCAAARNVSEFLIIFVEKTAKCENAFHSTAKLGNCDEAGPLWVMKFQS
jgi:hypothetical protein